MQPVSLLMLVGVIALAIPAPSAESMLGQYRGITLGDSLPTVIARLRLTPADVTVVHDQPVLVQQVTWRPRPVISDSGEETDPVAEMGLMFHAGQLTLITVDYARGRTQGLTDADVREALGRTYGPSLLLSTPTQPLAATPAFQRTAIGRWEDADTVVILWRAQFPHRIGLIITSTARAAAIERPTVDGAPVDAEAVAACERARRAAEAAWFIGPSEACRPSR